MIRTLYLTLALWLALGFTTPVRAHDEVPPDGDIRGLVGLDQRLGEPVPLDLPFTDVDGRAVTLDQVMAGRPVLLVLSYFGCESLCPLVRQGLVDALQPLAFAPGAEFDVVVVSVDPTDTPELAAATRDATLAAYGRPESAPGWRFLTGDHAAIDALADAVGFHYAYDADQAEYAHPSGLVVLTRGGQIARYLSGIEFDPGDLRLALVEAADAKIGSPLDQFLLLCYQYDPHLGRYTPAVMNLVRLAGLGTVVGLAVLVLGMLRQARPHPGQGA